MDDNMDFEKNILLLKDHFRMFLQTQSFDCGAASMNAIIHYHTRINVPMFDLYNIGYLYEKNKNDAHLFDDGLSGDALVCIGKKYGITPYEYENATLNDIVFYLTKDAPVLISFISPRHVVSNIDDPANNGAHYSVISGIKKTAKGIKLKISDPGVSINFVNGLNYWMDYSLFEKRWFDIDTSDYKILNRTMTAFSLKKI
jgi:hypothetical protein